MLSVHSYNHHCNQSVTRLKSWQLLQRFNFHLGTNKVIWNEFEFYQGNTKSDTASITKAWPHSSGVKLVCLHSRPFTYWKKLAYHDMKDMTHDFCAGLVLYQMRMGKIPLTKTPCNWSPQFPHIYGLLLKVEGMLHSGKHHPVTSFLRCLAAIKFKITLNLNI